MKKKKLPIIKAKKRGRVKQDDLPDMHEREYSKTTLKLNEKRKQLADEQAEMVKNLIRTYLFDNDVKVLIEDKWEFLKIIYTYQQISDYTGIPIDTIRGDFVVRKIIKPRYWPLINHMFEEVVKQFSKFI